MRGLITAIIVPSKSQAQHRFMEAVMHSPKFAKKAGVPQSVGADFVKADKGRDTKKLPERKGKK